MKLTVIRPIYVGGKVLVEGDVFETLEQHGRELVQKGYAVTVKSIDADEQPEQAKKNNKPKSQAK
ncbi:hypothetical protein [Atlantibacter sp.]|uniref:DUF7210 family protein n=1 Tax=Atlantibacter sp. TaxID=1903473 RepID=UPI00289E9917|nr:hypothetical protein [Atlantibacter sp.]